MTPYKITRPKRPLPNDLFEKVATVYRQAVADGHHNPGMQIAKASDIPIGTVHRWITTARAKGLLEPATPGRATGLRLICRTCGRPF